MYGMDDGIMSLNRRTPTPAPGPIGMANGGIASLPGLQDRFGRPWRPGSGEVPYQVGAGVLGEGTRGSADFGRSTYRVPRPEVVKPEIPEPVVPAPELAPVGGGEGESGYEPGPTTPFDSMSPAEQAQWYRDNPMFANATQLGQKVFGWTSLGMLQNMLAPEVVAQQRLIARGISPTDLSDTTPTTEGVPQNMEQAVVGEVYQQVIDSGSSLEDASVAAGVAVNALNAGASPAQAVEIATGGLGAGGGSPLGGDVPMSFWAGYDDAAAPGPQSGGGMDNDPFAGQGETAASAPGAYISGDFRAEVPSGGIMDSATGQSEAAALAAAQAAGLDVGTPGTATGSSLDALPTQSTLPTDQEQASGSRSLSQVTEAPAPAPAAPNFGAIGAPPGGFFSSPLAGLNFTLGPGWLDGITPGFGGFTSTAPAPSTTGGDGNYTISRDLTPVQQTNAVFNEPQYYESSYSPSSDSGGGWSADNSASVGGYSDSTGYE